jgi:hypothetical protein
MMEGTTSIKFDYMDEIKQITKSSKHGSKLSSSIWFEFHSHGQFNIYPIDFIG